MKQIIAILVGFGILISSCRKDKNDIVASGHVILVNEGGFGHGDASVSIYDPAQKSIANGVFFAQNGFALGDVAQSLYLIGDTAYIVMNNSQDIVLADAAHNFQYLGHIALPNSSPRYFMPVSASKAYITELYANKIWVIDFRAGVVTGSIATSGWTEQIISCNGKIYVAEQTKPSGNPVHKLLMIDPGADQVVNTLDLPTDPGSMALSDDNKLWVLTSPQSNPVMPASLYKVDPATLSVLQKLDFAPARTPARLRYASLSHQLFFADNGIYAMAQTDTTLPGHTFIASAGWNVYGLNADPGNGDIYIADAIDYQQASHVMRYSKDGIKVDDFRAGIITNAFVFR